METIEERAFEYANNNPHSNPYNWNAHHDAYMDGATKQRAIDIDKACRWVCDNCELTENCEFNPTNCPTIKSLIKAMEEL